MLIKFRKKGYSGIIPYEYEGKDEIHKYMRCEISMSVCMGRTTYQRKVPKWLPFKNYKSEMTKYLMCIYGRGHMCICIPNMKFLCLALWQGEVCTDANDDANTDINDGQSTSV